MSDTWIETYTGKQFFPLEPRTGDVDIVDIAHSLSMQCRFNGHTKVFYSVAEHCLVMAEELKAKGFGRRLQLYGLLHDASEAYLSDVPRPVKRDLPGYRAAEAEVQRVILKAFGIPEPSVVEKSLVKVMDELLLACEGRELMPNVKNWTGDIDFKLLSVLGRGFVESDFLETFNRLRGVIDDKN